MEEDFFEEGNISKIKRAVIAGAAEALNQKARDFKKEDNKILQDITDNVDRILGKID